MSKIEIKVTDRNCTIGQNNQKCDSSNNIVTSVMKWQTCKKIAICKIRNAVRSLHTIIFCFLNYCITYFVLTTVSAML